MTRLIMETVPQSCLKFRREFTLQSLDDNKVEIVES